MKAFRLTLLLFLLMLCTVLFNALYINRISSDLTNRLDALPDVDDERCLEEALHFCELWEKKSKSVSLSVGYPVVDRITEQAALLAACAECGDLYGYRSAIALLYDAVEDLQRLERLI